VHTSLPAFSPDGAGECYCHSRSLAIVVTRTLSSRNPNGNKEECRFYSVLVLWLQHLIYRWDRILHDIVSRLPTLVAAVTHTNNGVLSRLLVPPPSIITRSLIAGVLTLLGGSTHNVDYLVYGGHTV